MNISKSECIGYGIINLGVSLLIGIWLGIPAFFISFVVIYTIIALDGGFGSPKWNWFFDNLGISLPGKEE